MTGEEIREFKRVTSIHLQIVEEEERQNRMSSAKKPKLEDNGFEIVISDPSLMKDGIEVVKDTSSNEADGFKVLKVVTSPAKVGKDGFEILWVKTPSSSSSSDKPSATSSVKPSSDTASDLSATTAGDTSSSPPVKLLASPTVGTTSSPSAELDATTVKESHPGIASILYPRTAASTAAKPFESTDAKLSSNTASDTNTSGANTTSSTVTALTNHVEPSLSTPPNTNQVSGDTSSTAACTSPPPATPNSKAKLLPSDHDSTTVSCTTPIALNMASRSSGTATTQDLIAELGRLCVCYGFWVHPVPHHLDLPEVELFHCTGPFPQPPGYIAQGRCPVQICIRGTSVTFTTETHNHACIAPTPTSMDQMISAISPAKSRPPKKHSLSQPSNPTVQASTVASRPWPQSQPLVRTTRSPSPQAAPRASTPPPTPSQTTTLLRNSPELHSQIPVDGKTELQVKPCPQRAQSSSLTPPLPQPVKRSRSASLVPLPSFWPSPEVNAKRSRSLSSIPLPSFWPSLASTSPSSSRTPSLVPMPSFWPSPESPWAPSLLSAAEDDTPIKAESETGLTALEAQETTTNADSCYIEPPMVYIAPPSHLKRERSPSPDQSCRPIKAACFQDLRWYQ